MKLIAALALTVCPQVLAAAEPVKLFILAGTSNMLGHGRAADVPPPVGAPQDDVWIWRNDLAGNVGFTSLRPGFGATSTNWGSGGNGDRCTDGIIAAGRCGTLELGPELTLGRGLADAYPSHQIALVKHAGVGALAVEWHPDTLGPADQRHNYAALTEKMAHTTRALTEAGLDYEIAGLFWEVGADSRNVDEALTYKENFNYLITSVREGFADDPNMPFVIGRSNIALQDRPNRPFAEIVRDAQITVATADPFGAWVDGDDLSRKAPDDPHYDAAGQLELGRRMAHAYIAVTVPEPRAICLLFATAVVAILSRCRCLGAVLCRQRIGPIFATCLSFLLLVSSVASTRLNAAEFRFLPDTFSESVSLGRALLSDDGQTVVGRGSNDIGFELLRWSDIDGVRASTLSAAFSLGGVSADGSLVAGYQWFGETGNTRREAGLWTETSGMQSLDAQQRYIESRALALSADGSVIVGWGEVASGLNSALIWNNTTSPTELNGLPGYDSSIARDVSDDGTVIVGRSSLSSGQEKGTGANGINICLRAYCT